MQSSLSPLAAAADDLEQRQRAIIVETAAALTISGLAATDIRDLRPMIVGSGWSFDIVDAAGERADEGSFHDDFAPFVATIRKPEPSGALAVVTLAGLRAFLNEERDEEVWQVLQLERAFSTFATSFQPWGGGDIFSRGAETKSPRELVRELSAPRRAPADVRQWLVRGEVDKTLWETAAFRVFAQRAAISLMRALASEIDAQGKLIFSGPPRLSAEGPGDAALDELERDGFNQLRDAAAWVYEGQITAEQRHGLFAAELARSSSPRSTAENIFALNAQSALQGARVAYQLSLTDLTREAIKAQGDLRKAIADDMAKLADNTRQVAMAVAAALATGVGLLAAKASATTPSWLLLCLGMIGSFYVAAVIASSWIYMELQKDTRKRWRQRLYRFVPDGDWKAMVTTPAGKAELMFQISAVIGGVATVGLFVLTVTIR